MRKKWNVAAVVLCITLLTCACASGNTADANDSANDKKENIEDTKKTKKESKEKKYQSSLDMIQPRAYSNVEGLDLEPGAYISIIGKSASGQYWDAVKRGVDQAAKDLNKELGYEGKDKVKVTYSGPAEAESVDGQVNILDEEIARYPVAIGISIVDVKACEVQFDLASEGDIPVVAFDSGSDYQGLLATVATDNDSTARAAADKLAEAIGGAGEIIIIAGDSKSMTAQEREQSFTAQITEQHPEVAVVDAYHRDQLEEMQKRVADEINAGTYVPENADELPQEAAAESITEEDVMEYLLAIHPGVRGCFATNGEAVKLTLAALDSDGANEIKIVGYDADDEVIEALADGKITGLIVQNPFGMGYASVVAAARAAMKIGNEAIVNTGYTWVTKENMKDKNIEKILY